MKNIKSSLTLLTLGTLFSSCGSLKIRDKNPSEVSSIKSVALINLDMQEPRPKELAFNLGSGKVEGDRAMGTFQEKSSHVERLYSELARAIAINLKWRVLDRSTMASNPGFQKAYEKTMKGWQSKMPPGEGYAHFVTKGLLDYDSPRILDFEGREKLIRDLNVDAIVVAKVHVSLTGTSIMGFGPRKPMSVLSFAVYKKGIEKPIWFDGNVEGKKGASVGATGLWSVEKLQHEATESAIDAFSRIKEERK